VGVLDHGPLAEERVRVVEEEDRPGVSRSVEYDREVLLGLADVLLDHGGQVNPVEILLERVRDGFDRHRPARPGRAGEEIL
jgi:hypothetical protein